MKRIAWWMMALLALAIALYGLRLAIVGERAFVEVLAASFRARPWGIFFHALLSAIALGLGPFQFQRGLLVRRRALHRNLGRIYLVCAFFGGGVAGLYMSAFSFGGWITHTGFGVLALLTAGTAVIAYLKIKARDVAAHRSWMIRNFALIFAAVTLRLWLPLLIRLFGAFPPAYQTVSWLCWVPNLIWAEWFVARTRTRAVPAYVGADPSRPVRGR